MNLSADTKVKDRAETEYDDGKQAKLGILLAPMQKFTRKDKKSLQW